MKSKDYFIAKLERNGINLVASGHSGSDFHVLSHGHHLFFPALPPGCPCK
jgi:hypothetical protein